MAHNRIVSLVLGLTAIVQAGQENKQVEQMSWLDNGQIKLGVDLSIGGAITYLADSKTGDNIINSHDWGRQVQMSFYSGPNPYIPEGKTVNPAWKGLGWNPIQSGDCYGNRSKVISHTNNGKSIYVKCIPMIWPLDNVPGDCMFECYFQLEGRTVKVTSSLNNNRPDKTWYGDRSQELPAVYTNGPYHKLMTYTGDKPFTNDALVEIPKQQHPPGGIRWAHWTATENWAALVNEQNFGLGVWNDGVYSFIGGFACGQPGTGGPKDAPTGYIAPIKKEVLDYNIQYEFRYVLIVDTLNNIRQYVYEHAAKNPLPSFDFSKDRQSWICRNVKDAGWPIKGCMDIQADDKHAELHSPDVFWPAKSEQTLTITAAAANQDNKSLRQMRLYWKTNKNNGFAADRSVEIEIPADGDFHSTTLALGKQTGYQDNITGLRLDPFIGGQPGDRIRIKSIQMKESH